MAHIDFEQHFLRYNLAQIYLDLTSEDPRLGAFEIPVALATDFILGRFFTEEVSQALLLSILDNQRCISMGIHAMMASRIAFEQANEARFQACLPLVPHEHYMVQDAVCELNFFQHRFDDTTTLRSLVSLLSYENQMADIDVGEVHFITSLALLLSILSVVIRVFRFTCHRVLSKPLNYTAISRSN